MTPTTIASSAADADAASAIRSHHAELTGALLLGRRRRVRGRATAPPDDARRAARHLHDWCERELLPHARAEEETLYPAAAGRLEATLLVASMVAEHRVLGDLVAELGGATSPVAAAAAARALRAVFEAHVGKENDLILPVLEVVARHLAHRPARGDARRPRWAR